MLGNIYQAGGGIGGVSMRTATVQPAKIVLWGRVRALSTEVVTVAFTISWLVDLINNDTVVYA